MTLKTFAHAAAFAFGCAALMFTAAGPASAEPPQVDISKSLVQICPPPPTSDPQFCGPPLETTFTMQQFGYLRVEFRADRGHCSDIIVKTTIDGQVVATDRVRPGKAAIDARPADAGVHTVAISAVGFVNGCNTGRLGSWEGTVYISTSALPPLSGGLNG